MAKEGQHKLVEQGNEDGLSRSQLEPGMDSLSVAKGRDQMVVEMHLMQDVTKPRELVVAANLQ